MSLPSQGTSALATSQRQWWCSQVAHPSRSGSSQVAERETLLARLTPGHTCLPPDIPRTQSVSLPWAYLSPLSLVHLLMVSLFMALSTLWHMMHAKSDSMRMNERLAPYLHWFRAATIEPLQGIAALTSVELADATLAKKQRITTSLVPPTPPLQSPIQNILLQQSFQMQAPAPP